MADREPKPNNPLSPYDSAQVPDMPGDARSWFAVLVSVLLVVGMAAGALSLLFPF